MMLDEGGEHAGEEHEDLHIVHCSLTLCVMMGSRARVLVHRGASASCHFPLVAPEAQEGHGVASCQDVCRWCSSAGKHGMEDNQDFTCRHLKATHAPNQNLVRWFNSRNGNFGSSYTVSASGDLCRTAAGMDSEVLWGPGRDWGGEDLHKAEKEENRADVFRWRAMTRHAMTRRVMSFHDIDASCRVTLCHDMARHVVSRQQAYHVTACNVVSVHRHVTPTHGHFLSCQLWFFHVVTSARHAIAMACNVVSTHLYGTS